MKLAKKVHNELFLLFKKNKVFCENYVKFNRLLKSHDIISLYLMIVKYVATASSTDLPYASTLRLLFADSLVFLTIFITKGVTIKVKITNITSEILIKRKKFVMNFFLFL